MSIFSDYKVGALSDLEFEQECARMNRQDRWERDHMYDDLNGGCDYEIQDADDGE